MFEQWKVMWRMQRWGEEWPQVAQLTAAELKTTRPMSDFMPKYSPPTEDTGDFGAGMLKQLAESHARNRRGR